jgi:hypothetical protein
MYNGMFCDYHPIYRPGGAGYDWCQATYGTAELMMKWNDAWLDNTDCDGDRLLDRHYGFDTYIGSGAWLTNHMKWDYVDEAGEACSASDFIKIVAASTDAEAVGGIWYAADGTEIGEVIWGDFAIVQYVLNDACGDAHGIDYKSMQKPGLGNW